MNEQDRLPLAVLGVGCYLPGAQNANEFWSLLVEGKYCVSPLPADLFDRELFYDSSRGIVGKTYSNQAGLVERFENDPAYRAFPSRLAEFADTVPLMMCRAAADAFREARVDPSQLDRPNMGVYVGCNTAGPRSPRQQYALIAERAGQTLAELPAFRELAGPGAAAAVQETLRAVRSEIPAEDVQPSRMTVSHVAANAVSEAYGLTGPSVVLDAVCSSSLKALAVAQRDLEQGAADAALVGGAYSFSLEPLLMFGMSRAATAGRSCPFSQAADGIVMAEAYVMILVKPLDRAIRDGDPIQCVVRSIGISADGKGKGTWAPRKEGQVASMRRAYRDDADMKRLVYLEAHATSTQVGDVTEMEALTEVFAGHLPSKIPMGSMKANLGHPLEAAGLAGLVKAMLVLRHNLVPQQIHCEPLNPKVDWDALPFFLPKRKTPLNRPSGEEARWAAINAFGIGGLNAHAVIEEAPAELATARKGATVGRGARVSNSVREPAALGTGEPRARHAPEPIAVIGCGAVFAGAKTLEAFQRLIYSPEIAVGPVPEGRWYHGSYATMWAGQGDRSTDRVGGFVRDFHYDWRRHRISPKQIAKANPLFFMLLDSVDAALADAGYGNKAFDRATTEVVVGTNFETDFFPEFVLGARSAHFVSQVKNVLRARGLDDEHRLESLGQRFSRRLLQEMPAILDELGSFTPSGLASRLAKTLDLMGGAGSVDSGSTSAVAAIAQSAASLRSGASSMVICVAGGYSVGLQLHALRNNPQTRQGETSPPPGEGAGTVILKRLGDAKRDGDPIRAVIHSIGTGFSADPAEAFQLAIRRAWNMAGTGGAVAPTSVASIEISTATGPASRSEVEAIASFFGPHRDGKPIPLGSIDSQIGDTMAASGMASVIKSCLQLERLSVPSSVGPRAPCDAAGTTQKSLMRPGKETPIAAADLAGSVVSAVSSYDSFGAAYHLILERGTPVPGDAMKSESPSPLLSRFHAFDDVRSIAEVALDPRNDPFLRDHRFRLRPLLPGVIAAEAFAQAALRASSRRHVVAIRDLRYVEGLRFLDDETRIAKVHVQREGDAASCRLTVDFRNRRGDLVKADRLHTSGVVDLGDESPRLSAACPSECPSTGWYDMVYQGPESMMYHGPVFQQMYRLVFGDSASWGECRIGSPAEVAGTRGEQGWTIWPATIDACLYLGGLTFWRLFRGIMGLPQSIGRLRFGRPPRPEEACLIHVKIVRSDEKGAEFDFGLFGDDREALLLGEDYYLQLVPTSKGTGVVFREPRTGGY